MLATVAALLSFAVHNVCILCNWDYPFLSGLLKLPPGSAKLTCSFEHTSNVSLLGFGQLPGVPILASIVGDGL